MNHSLRYFLFALVGMVAGAIGLALGAYLASAGNGWGNSLYYSAVGIVCAPLATLSWATHRLHRSQTFAGISLFGGFLASMAILLELTAQHPTMAEASSQAPFAFSCWFSIWVLWNAMALVRLILFTPPRTRDRLSDRRHYVRPKVSVTSRFGAQTRS